MKQRYLLVLHEHPSWELWKWIQRFWDSVSGGGRLCVLQGVVVGSMQPSMYVWQSPKYSHSYSVSHCQLQCLVHALDQNGQCQHHLEEFPWETDKKNKNYENMEKKKDPKSCYLKQQKYLKC